MDISQKTINYLKSLSAETVSNAKSGHTGTALGASSILFALFHDHLIFNPYDTEFVNRDRFVMSAGHASALLYSLLHLFKFNITIDDLKNFRKYGSNTPGHPELDTSRGIENTSGPLGQGVASAVGFAIAEAMLSQKFNTKKYKIFDHYTYCFAGDGCLMEGVAVEACSLAGSLGLNKLILLYDNNDITIEGNRNLANQEDTALKFKAMGWNVIEVKNGNDNKSCSSAIEKAKKSDKPTIIIFKTIIGIGTKKQGSHESHAMPLSAEDLAELKAALNVEGSFYVPEDVYNFCNETINKNKKLYDNWNKLFDEYKQKEPLKYNEYKLFCVSKKIDYNKILKSVKSLGEVSGRDMSHKTLNEFAKFFPNLVGGSADVAPSTKAYLDGEEYFSASNRLGKNIHFGIREHSMAAICNGIALSNFLCFDSTFLGFSNYMLPAIRLRAMMKLPVLSIFSHDSINIGQDGPSHQPIEQISMLRQIIGLNVWRPATPAEMVASYKFYFDSKLPTAIIVPKSKLEDYEKSTLELAQNGGYIIFETTKKPDVQIFATGSEVSLAIKVAEKLKEKFVNSRVISMPCESLFCSQPKTYKNSVISKTAKVNAVIEASNDNVWYKYLNSDDLLFNVTSYQFSGKGDEVYKKAGFDEDKILKEILKKLQ